MRARVFAVAFLALVPTLTAQSERLTIRMAPAPNQTIRQQMTIVVAMTTTPRLSSSDSPSVPPEQGEMKTTMDLTSTVGPIDRRGEYNTWWAAPSASNERIRGENDPWLQWIRERVAKESR